MDERVKVKWKYIFGWIKEEEVRSIKNNVAFI